MGGRAGEGDAMVVYRFEYVATVTDNGGKGDTAVNASLYLDISVGNSGVGNDA